MTCSYHSFYSDSGDRGADMHEHNRAFHPDHAHVWADSSYDWEQAGQTWIAPGDGMNITIRPFTVQRCAVCALRDSDDSEGKCS